MFEKISNFLDNSIWNNDDTSNNLIVWEGQKLYHHNMLSLTEQRDFVLRSSICTKLSDAKFFGRDQFCLKTIWIQWNWGSCSITYAYQSEFNLAAVDRKVTQAIWKLKRLKFTALSIKLNSRSIDMNSCIDGKSSMSNLKNVADFILKVRLKIRQNGLLTCIPDVISFAIILLYIVILKGKARINKLITNIGGHT